MPQILNLPTELIPKPGVEMNAPPVALIPSITDMVTRAVANRSPDKDGLFTLWVDTTAGVNLAHVQRIGGQVDVLFYVGKTWGKPITAGVAAHWEF